MLAATLSIGPVEPTPQSGPTPVGSGPGRVFRLLGGAAVGFLAHESGHLLFDAVFAADPGFRRVDFAGIPFFAITHRSDVSPRQEYVISSAGFSVQHATSEWLLSRRPRLREESAPLAKGMLAFNVLVSVAYGGAAFARAGPAERDTRGMAVSLGVSERWVGALVLAPALLDTYRYHRPQAGWAKWSSRAIKVGMVLLALKPRSGRR